MIYGLLLIVLVLVSLILLGLVVFQPTRQDDNEPEIIYTQAGKVHPGRGLQKR